jgi:UDP-GlcNAc:undecaprenyl-phosphate GlcNAc-1-phosphate transferase
VLWIVGITNAFNLIDNMDGLSAGISALTILPMLAINAYFNQTALFAINSIFLAATAGFLFYNFNPAKIFMGDAGSLFIGFFLSISAIGMISQSPLPTEQMVIATLLIFFVPLFDMSYVTIMRKIHGRKITIGGKDHTSHRLAVITKSEQMPVLILYFLNILAGMAGWWLITRNFIFFSGTVALLIICSVYIFFRVAKINVYQN